MEGCAEGKNRLARKEPSRRSKFAPSLRTDELPESDETTPPVQGGTRGNIEKQRAAPESCRYRLHVEDPSDELVGRNQTPGSLRAHDVIACLDRVTHFQHLTKALFKN